MWIAATILKGAALLAAVWLFVLSARAGARMRRIVDGVGRPVVYDDWPEAAKMEFRRMMKLTLAAIGTVAATGFLL